MSTLTREHYLGSLSLVQSHYASQLPADIFATSFPSTAQHGKRINFEALGLVREALQWVFSPIVHRPAALRHHSLTTNSREGMACADWDTQLSDVVNHRVGLEQIEGILEAFASSKDFAEVVLGLKEKDAGNLVDLLDQVCRSPGYLRPPNNAHHDQVIGPIDRRNTQSTTLLRALGIICSVTTQLPCSAVLSDGLKKCGSMAVASGGFTDVWRGTHYTNTVAIKAFRTYPVQDLKEAKKVRHTLCMRLFSFFDDPRRFYGRRWSYGRDCLIRTSCRSMEST